MTPNGAERAPFPAFPALNDVARTIAYATSLREAVNQDTWDANAFSCLVSIAGLGAETMTTALALAESYREGLQRLYEPARYPTSIMWRVTDGPCEPPVRDREQVLGFTEHETAATLGLALVCVDRTRVEVRVPLVWCACLKLRPAAWETPRPALRDVVRAVGATTTLADATNALRARGLWPSDAPPVEDTEALIAVASLGVPTVLALRALAREAAREVAVTAGVRTSPDAWTEFPWTSLCGPATKDSVGTGLADMAAARLCGAVLLRERLCGVDVGYGAQVPRVPRTELADARGPA